MDARAIRGLVPPGVHDCEHARAAATLGHHEWACFAAPQAGEKALKALAARLGGEARGHSVLAMVRDLTPVAPDVATLRETATLLDRFYIIPTRYPNGFDRGAPVDETDAREAITLAEQVLDFVRRRLR